MTFKLSTLDAKRRAGIAIALAGVTGMIAASFVSSATLRGGLWIGSGVLMSVPYLFAMISDTRRRSQLAFGTYFLVIGPTLGLGKVWRSEPGSVQWALVGCEMLAVAWILIETMRSFREGLANDNSSTLSGSVAPALSRRKLLVYLAVVVVVPLFFIWLAQRS